MRWCSQLHLISSLAVPGVSKSWSGVKESVACVAGGIIVPGALSWRRTCHSKRVKGENPSLTCSQSSRGFAAKKLQHSRLNRQLRRLRRVWVSVPFFVPIPSVSSLHESPLYEFGTPCMVIILEYEQSLFFLIVRRAKRARQAKEHEHKWRRENPWFSWKKKKFGILLPLTEKMLLIKRKTNLDFGYLKELRLPQDSLQMIWRCLGFWGTLNNCKMWKNSAERSYSCGILGQLRFNTDKCKVMRISKKTKTVVAS